MFNPVGAVQDILTGPFGSGFRDWQRNIARRRATPAHPCEMYGVLRAYYLQNALYEDLARAAYTIGVDTQTIKALRNPANRVVEFYPAHIWPGTLPKALPIETTNARIIQPIQQVWTWSNWASKKQIFARNLAMLGDQYIKVCMTDERDRVYYQLLDPETVTETKYDARDNLTWCRIDVAGVANPDAPVLARQNPSRCYTEVWDLESQTVRVWYHAHGNYAELARLGLPSEETTFAELGIDFVPIVPCQFRNIGDPRGVGAFTLQLDKIDEANRQATRLHQLLFRHNNVTWALSANSVDGQGRPLPAPQVPRGAAPTPGGSTESTTQQPPTEPGTVRMGGEVFLRLAGNATLTPLIPDINYGDALAVLAAQLNELAEELTELRFYRLSDATELSGRAILLLLSPAISRALEVRGNAEQALARADAMALTMGADAGLWSTDIGQFDAGDYQHTFSERPVLGVSEAEKAETDQARVQALLLRAQLGVPKLQLLQELGYTKQQAEEFLANPDQNTDEVGAQLLEAFNRGQ